MKKLLMILSAVLALSLLCSATAFAEAVPTVEEETALVLADLATGETPDNSFVVVEGGEEILEVAYVEMPGAFTALSGVTEAGYYTADFTMPDGYTQVFLTGLTRDNVDEIEKAVKNGYQSGRNFELRDLGFIDAEKTVDEDNDDNLCWAASSANTLLYTGWAAQAGFTDSDNLFELFVNAFDNKGGHAYYGYAWFFNGTKNINEASAMPVDYPDSGSYLPQYPFDEFADNFDLWNTGTDGMNTLYSRLRDGYGVVLNVDIYKDGAKAGGHAVTCWGFVTDSRYADTEKAYYKSVIITDSDSDKFYSERREAPDVMHIFALTSQEQGSINTYSFLYDDGQLALFNDCVTLQPYRDGLPQETDVAATKDRRSSADLRCNLFYLTSEQKAQETATKYAVDSPIYYQPFFLNAGDVNYVGDFTIDMQVTDKNNGATLTDFSLRGGTLTVEPGMYLNFGSRKLPLTLPVGDYTITASINSDHAVSEAYYFNNSRSIDFKVRDTYTVGDTDDDGWVTVIDATWVQRAELGYDAALSENYAQRGDVDASGQLDVTDATQIQRYGLDLRVDTPIGKTQIYD